MVTVNSPSFQRQLLITTVIPLFIPLLSWILPTRNNHHRRLVSIWEAQSKVFFTTSLLSFLLYHISNYFMFYGTAVVNPEHLSYSVFLNWSDVLDHVRSGMVAFLKRDPSVAAMAYDVMLTLVVLLSWIPVNTVSLLGMMKCSLNPWLETKQRTVWDHTLDDLGPALAAAYERRPVQFRREPPWWKLPITVALWVVGGIGWAICAVLGAGTRHLDP